MPISSISQWSSDQTATPTQINADVKFNAAKTIGLATGDGTVLYRCTVAGTWSAVTVSTLFGSPDGQRVLDIAWGSANIVVLLCKNASDEIEVLYSIDGGANFTESASDFSAFDATTFGAIASNGGTTFAITVVDPGATYDFIGLVSTDSGATWGSAFNGPAVSVASTLRLFYDATSAQWFSVGFSGISRSSDLVTWSAFIVPSGSETTRVAAGFCRFGNRLIMCGYAATGSAYTPLIAESRNDGASWTRLQPLGFGSAPLAALPLAVTVVDGTLVAACARLGSGSYVYRSANAISWVASPDELSLAPTQCYAVAEGLDRLHFVANDYALSGTTFAIFSAVYESANPMVEVFRRGVVRYRLIIEGADSEWCNDISLASGADDEGRLRYPALMMAGATLTEMAEIREGTTKISPLSLRVVGSAADREFAKAATKLAYLAASVTTADEIEIDVSSDALFTVGDYIHLGTECMRVEAIDTGTLTVTRQLRLTRPQAHTRADTLSTPGWEVPIYDKPPTLQGRRAVLLAYPIDTTDESAVVWQGRLASHPYLEDDGVTWRLDIDHLSTLLDQTIGEVAAGEAGLRNAVYHQACQFSFDFAYTRAGVAISGRFALEGAYSNDEELFADIIDAIDALSLTGTTWSVGRTGGGEIAFTMTTDTSFADAGTDLITRVRIGSAIDGVTDEATRSDGVFDTLVLTDSDTKIFVLNKSRRPWTTAAYRDSALSYAITSTPRGVVGDPRVGYDTRDLYEDETLTDSEYVLYLDRDIGCVAGRSVITLRGAISPEGERFDASFRVAAVSGAGLTVTVEPFGLAPVSDFLRRLLRRSAPCVYYDDQTTCVARVFYGTGSWRDLLQVVVDESYRANTGATPFVTGGDLETGEFFTDEVTRRLTTGNPSSILERNYEPAIETALIDILTPELLLTGCMLRMSANGLIGVAPLARPSPLAPVAITLDGSNIITPYGNTGKWPGLLSSPDGVVCTVLIKDGDAEFLVRDEIAISHFKNRGAGMLEIEPKSTIVNAPADPLEVASICRRILSFFSHAYSVITVPVSYRAIGVLVGDVVQLDTPHLIDPATGLRGLSARCLCIGRAWPLDVDGGPVHGELTLLAFNSNLGGYCPSAYVSATSGDFASLDPTTLTVIRNLFAIDDGDDLDHFAVGDPVRVVAFNTTSTLGFRGTITSIPSDTSVVIDVTEYLGDPAGYTLHMEFDSAAVDVTENQEPYCYIADAAGEVEGERGFDFE